MPNLNTVTAINRRQSRLARTPDIAGYRIVMSDQATIRFTRRHNVAQGTQIDTYEQRGDEIYLVCSFVENYNGTTADLPVPSDPVDMTATDEAERAVREWLYIQLAKAQDREKKRLTFWKVRCINGGRAEFVNDEYGFATKQAAKDAELKSWRQARQDDMRQINYHMDALKRHGSGVAAIEALNAETAIVVREDNNNQT